MAESTSEAQVLELDDIQGTVLRQRPHPTRAPTSCCASMTRRTAAGCCSPGTPRGLGCPVVGSAESRVAERRAELLRAAGLRLPPASRDGFPAEFRAGIVIDRAGARLASQLGCT
jgi:hypothetical protein